MPKKISKEQLESIKANLGAVTDLQGNEVPVGDEFIETVEFEARGRKYQVAVQTNAYSTADVMGFQDAQEKAAKISMRSEARELVERLVEDFPLTFETDSREVKRLVKSVHKLVELLPANEQAETQLDGFKRQAGFILIGALAWNVPDIDLTQDGLIGGDFRVVSEAAGAIMKALNPTSTEATDPENQKEATPSDDKTSSTGSLSLVTAEA